MRIYGPPIHPVVRSTIACPGHATIRDRHGFRTAAWPPSPDRASRASERAAGALNDAQLTVWRRSS